VKLVREIPVAELSADNDAGGVSEVITTNRAPAGVVEHFQTSYQRAATVLQSYVYVCWSTEYSWGTF